MQMMDALQNEAYQDATSLCIKGGMAAISAEDLGMSLERQDDIKELATRSTNCSQNENF
jgi:hypothetical protein